MSERRRTGAGWLQWGMRDQGLLVLLIACVGGFWRFWPRATPEGLPVVSNPMMEAATGNLVAILTFVWARAGWWPFRMARDDPRGSLDQLKSGVALFALCGLGAPLLGTVVAGFESGNWFLMSAVSYLGAMFGYGARWLAKAGPPNCRVRIGSPIANGGEPFAPTPSKRDPASCPDRA